ncbi:MAG: nucleotidyltransferase family protein [Novosphingobium sp.]
MDRPALRRVLLDLVGTAERTDLAVLNPADWAELDRIAAQHRLQPLLHAQRGSNSALPPAIAAAWKAAHRQAALRALTQQADLAETIALLDHEGFAVVALKGAWLSTQAYPEAAQRPMRDIDLLVAPDGVMAAYELLLAAGYQPEGESEMPLADVVRLDKHMPPLIAPRGTRVELHHRLWERDGRLDHASPASDEVKVRDRARITPEGLRYPAPDDLLAHLIVHAVYSHRLDCGPLILADIDFLLRSETIDWPAFWADASAHGWRDGARLLLELTARYRPAAPIDLSADTGQPAPAALITAAPDLLLQDLETRASAGLAAATLKDGPAKLAQRIGGRRKVTGEMAVTRQMSSEGGLLGWAGSRAMRSLRDLARADVRRQSRQLAQLSRWLDR